MAKLRDETIVQGDETVTGNLVVNGAISGATVNTGHGANELYPMNQSVKTTDSPTFASINTGHGANELHPMNQGVRTTDSPTFASLAVTGNATVGGTLGVTGAITGATINTGPGVTEVHLMNQNVRTTDNVTFATVNTGHGANELHPMNQGVRTTDSPTFANATISGHNIDSELDTLNSRVNQDVKTTASPTFAGVNTGFGANEVYKTSTENITANSTTAQLSAMVIGEVRHVYFSCSGTSEKKAYLKTPAGGNFYITPATGFNGGSYAGNTNFASYGSYSGLGVFIIRRNS